jgi:hypothetical protein
LDHHIATGDSLIGATLQDLARQPPGAHRAALPPPRTARLFEVETDAQMARQVLPDRFRLAEEAGDTPAAVRAKERTLDGLTAPGTPLHRWKGAADLWCAGWFWTDGALNPATYGDLLAAILQRSPSLSRTQSDGLLQRAEAIARALRPFHWQLEFPEAFFDRDGGCRVDGGFDAVLGNPPWEMLRADTGPAARRVEERAIQKDQLRFYRASGIYGLHGGGHVNQYQLFAERALQLLRPGGRLGLVLPAGVATDHGSAALRRTLFATLEIDRLFGFTNRDGIFPIHRDMRFVLLTGSKSGRTDALACRFGLRDTAWLDTLPDAASLDPPEARPIVLSRGVLERWDPGHLAVPELESARDLDILVHVVDTAPKLSDAAGWNVRFGRELNASDDRHHFVTRSDDASLLPIVEGKHVEPFRTLLDRCTTGVPAKTAARLLERRTTFGHPRIAYRDVASATNKLTLIAAILPENTVSTHTLFCSKRTLGTKSLY